MNFKGKERKTCFMSKFPTPTRGGIYNRAGTMIMAPPKPVMADMKEPLIPIRKSVMRKNQSMV